MISMSIYETIIGYIENKKQIFMFYYGHGGTGKTFLWTTILSYFRSIGKVVLAVATSGIVSLLLPSGTTAYSRFKIPIDLTNKKSCDIKKRTMLGDLMCHTSLIVWDEAPMSDRRCFEFLDRQTLPVVPKSTRSEIIALTLPNSYLWALFEVMMLTENMCLLSNTDAETHTISIIDFARWILNIGDGLLGCPNTDDPDNTSWVQIPESLLIPSEPSALKDLIQFVYGDCILTHPIAIDVSQREIVCPTNEVADKINNIVLKAITNSGVPNGKHTSDLEGLYPIEYLNELVFPGIPPHALHWKQGTSIIYHNDRNFYWKTCIHSSHKFIHTPSDLSFSFLGKQFPVKICYAMTINKIQGQSLRKISVYLAQPIFAHGQLYVAFSRATSPATIKIVIETNEH
uniref:ATP-dependent DNA helicase n=1 Tax=Lactuca sativa TaxID=4236 RepID=A0A9R1XJQ8_LACSA|nr:hypothetical protein LSAT_V11C400191970 [Lactuca sativa]